MTYLVTGGQEPTRGVGGQAGLQSGGLSVVVDVVDNDTLQNQVLCRKLDSLGYFALFAYPVSVDVPRPLGHAVHNIGGAEVAFGSDPVGQVVGRGALGRAGVIVVVESLLLVLVDVLHQVVGRLVGHIRVLLLEQVVLRDGQLDLVLGVVGVLEAVVEAGGVGAVRGQLGVAVPLGVGVRDRGVIGGGAGMVGSVIGRRRGRVGGIGGGRGVVHFGRRGGVVGRLQGVRFRRGDGHKNTN